MSGFSNLKTQEKSLKADFVLKNIEDRIAQSSKMRDDCIKKIAKLMIQKGLTLEEANLFLDEDRSGIITRDELNEGFKKMGVTVNEALIKNIFVILDSNGDNEIDLVEFEAVFSKYMSKGGPVQEVAAADLTNGIIDEATAKDLAKQHNNEIKKKVEYTDTRLEAVKIEDLTLLEEQRVMDIQSGSI